LLFGSSLFRASSPKSRTNERSKNMKIHRRWFLAICFLMLAVAWAMPIGSSAGPREADHVRWDIISIIFTTTPFPTISAGGVASAIAPSNLRITLTGSGTFVSPASGGTSGAVTGGGTWETFGPTGASTGSGTYQVTKLVDWEFANFQPPVLIDLIGNENGRSNGNAVLRIEYSDGSQGVLGVGCHGPGAPDGIIEGVIASKGFVTYWESEEPVPGVDANRTTFHILR
jgi:hypothetical protein